ncbi:MAG: glucose-1-phosphate adenylyltransferase subunit GlgD [Defluviitaleaceae bacterium]|nr:glucose-1-phosphate adenylyltransferase subunit GlgD [Defluviitaleaceae bacterium]MCL2239607.1 glucose-1-phosphate adenylyltransferase subunit GlgD [Defluviitaleaceae bacterium]
MKAVGIILAGGGYERLGELTNYRTTSAIPVGSCYRAIDFPLSNMTNSGIKKVAIITQNNSRSLHDHLSSPKWWDLGSKQGGMFVLSPFLAGSDSGWFKGTADSIYQNLTFLRRSNEPYVVISSGNCVYKMDFNDVIAYHERKNAEITIAYRRVPDSEDIRNYGVLELDENERLTDLEEKPLDPQSDLASIGVYVIKRELLINLLETISNEGRHNLVRDIFSRYRKRLMIYGYKFDGYWRNLSSISSYYDCNMDFLKRDIRALLAIDHPYIKTKPKDEPPAKFNARAVVTNCLVGSGAILDGVADSSVIFRKVYTGEGSQVRNSIIMEGTRIREGCVVEYAILDKEVVLSPWTSVIGTPDEPIIIPKGTVK